MESYGQYCPVAHAAEILAERWTPLIVRELLAGIERFNELERGLPGISRALLAQRLRRLEAAGVIERRMGASGRRAYRLTMAGRGLQQLIDALGAWGARWAFGEPQPHELDPGLLVWWMHRRMHMDKVPARLTVIEFQFHGERSGRYWLVLKRREASVCLEHPGFDVELVVSADVAAFYRVFLGRMPFERALRAKLIQLKGMPNLVRAFPDWFAWSPMAEVVRSYTAPAPVRPRRRVVARLVVDTANAALGRAPSSRIR
jgi:DNA-binding HxlR family transcriptional regulator